MKTSSLVFLFVMAFACCLATSATFAKAPASQYVAKYVHGSHLHKGHSSTGHHSSQPPQQKHDPLSLQRLPSKSVGIASAKAVMAYRAKFETPTLHLHRARKSRYPLA